MSLEKVGVGWEKQTKDADGKVTNSYLSFVVDIPLDKGENIMVFRQSDEKIREIFKREPTEKDPRLIMMRRRK